MNIQSGQRDWIRHGKMRHVNNEKRETIHDGRNRCTKPRKDQNVRRKRNSQLLGNTISGHHLICGNERQNKEKVS